MKYDGMTAQFLTNNDREVLKQKVNSTAIYARLVNVYVHDQFHFQDSEVIRSKHT